MNDKKTQTSEKPDEVKAFDINKSDRKEETTKTDSDDDVKGNAFRVNGKPDNDTKDGSKVSTTD